MQCDALLNNLLSVVACVRYDERVRDLLDLSIYLDISNEVKFAWKVQVRRVSILLIVRTLLSAWISRPFILSFHSAERHGRAWAQP